MRYIDLFRKGSVVKSFYNSDAFKIDYITKVNAKNDSKFLVHMTSLSSGEKISKCTTFKEFSDEYYVITNEGVGKEDVIKLGDKLRLKNSAAETMVCVDSIDKPNKLYGLKEMIGSGTYFFCGTERDLLEKYELVKGVSDEENPNSPLTDFKLHVQFNHEEQQLLVIEQDLTSIERQGNIDRLLEIGDFEKLRNYLAE